MAACGLLRNRKDSRNLPANPENGMTFREKTPVNGGIIQVDSEKDEWGNDAPELTNQNQGSVF